ncbi:DUF6468 domain-containing protein [Methylobacterium gnaphalii]|uniref:DUF6468 domain-containing protein n=1 Tax=Methylobacterium gnaphalii TaxID=1010610 RepID=A0A512JEJ3_9HYPH|nr:DUF6468 domain-containing protein [Methylobacterium gnaphalii]GEP08357.1 hypothetical protein MGN01_02020 [Methylobacterium gnaphalii]GJD67867.1 hypothetical protein MMMDOFMJ_0784 [Methylobacterium gnaphalii]GLS51012.1 hypothetical protein GCM10007885_38660 [Methylobacterium gnaphalii]
MSLFITLAADALVAVLLVATILTSVKLSRRITAMKTDESAMRRTIGDLVTASAAAERAFAGLRATLDECDRGLSERLDAAERSSAQLAAHVQAGEGVIARIGAIVSQAGRPTARRDAEPATVGQPVPMRQVSASERLDVALAAAQAMSERALDRLRAKAA